MAMISAVLFFLGQNKFLSVLFIAILFGLLGTLLARITKNRIWHALWIIGFVLGVLNVFFMSSLNAVFLANFGVAGKAVITHAQRTNSQLNNQFTWAYDAVMTTADGRDVGTGFDTMSANIYPPRNRIDVPPVGERFVIRYIPGFERNIVIMRDESPFGRRQQVQDALVSVERARGRWQASPANPDFKADYRNVLRSFLGNYKQDLPAGQAAFYRDELGRLDGTMPSSR
jgi:hypothetical protein